MPGEGQPLLSRPPDSREGPLRQETVVAAAAAAGVGVVFLVAEFVAAAGRP